MPRLSTDAAPATTPLPVVVELTPAPAADGVFRALSVRPYCLFLDSALRHPTLGRFSFVTADPFAFLEQPADGSDALTILAQHMAGFHVTRRPDLPPFQGGVAGLFGYELGRGLEDVPRAATDEFQVPALAVGLYDVLVAFDHHANRAWIVSQGFPETDPPARRDRAEARAEQVRSWIGRSPPSAPARACRPRLASIPRDQLAAQLPVTGPAGLVSNFSAAGYCRAVQRVIDYICAGDVFQVNLSQRLLFPHQDDPVALYQRLRTENPAPFAAYFDLGDFQICSTSPERFLRMLDRQVEARPIKGTRPRTACPEADLFAADDLRRSEKDRAENVMIVDLLRNDLSKVCGAETVCVQQLCAVEQYTFVQHLVSVIHGHLRAESTPVHLLRGLSRRIDHGGTQDPGHGDYCRIGADGPWRRAYCGSLGYVGFDGTLDASILIRTITAGRGWWQVPVGGGIVVQSVPQHEYEETWHKAEGMLRALLPRT